MSAPKHTDGPWFCDQYGHVYGWRPTENGKTSVLLIDNRHSDATSADKSLISAAPDMLKALQTIVREFSCGRTPLASDLSAACIAIAKATGEAA